MKQKQNQKRQWAEFLAAAALVLLLCALPLASRDLRMGHDALFHMLRLEGLARAIRGGAALPVRVYSLVAGGYGYGCGLFYPDLFLYPFALLRAYLLGPELAFKALLMACAAMQCVTTYAAGRGITKNHTAALIFMISYCLCQYHLSNLYIRSAVGEAQAMVFVPLVVWGLWNMTEQGFDKPWVLGLGFTGLMFTHTISLAICGLMAILWTLLRFPRVCKPRVLIKGAAAAAACLLLSACYWLPMLEQFGADTFKATAEPLTNLWLNRFFWPLPFSLTSYEGLGASMLAALVLIPLYILCKQKNGRAWPKASLVFWAAGAVTALMPLCGPLWKLLDATFLTSIQFPWRFNFISQLFLCLSLTMLCAGQNDETENNNIMKRRAAIVLTVVLSAANLAFLWGTLPQALNYPENYFDNRGETFYLVGQEWVPEGVNIYEFAAEPQAQYTTPDGNIHTGRYTPEGAFEFDFDGTAGAYGIPKLWYKGYTARLNGTQGDSLAEISLHKDGAGRVELSVPEGLPSGIIRVEYTGTALQRLGNGLSLLGLLVGAVLYTRRKTSAKHPDALSGGQTVL